jgi:SPP1 gp7 family putative phage head morphogenesis protein
MASTIRRVIFGNKRPSKRRIKWLFPKQAVRQYEAYLLSFIEDIESQIRRVLLGELPTILAEKASENVRQDSAQSNLEKMLEALKITLKGQPESDLKLMTMDVGQRTHRWNNKEWQKTVKGIMGVNILMREPWLNDALNGFVAENVGLITSLRAQVLGNVEETIRRGFSAGLRHETIMTDIADRLGVAKTRARLIARDQVSKLNGALTKERQQDAGLSLYTWETSDDSRVREKTKSTSSHRALDGKLCRWDDNTVYSDDNGKTWKSRAAIGAFVGIPGQDFQCRCWAKPVFEEIEQ